jgi:PST family polysaccharide transporter
LKEDFVASLADTTTFARKTLNSSVGRNVVSLYLLQFGNYVLPLATVPYLVRVLGPEKFGLVAFGQGLIAYFTLAVNFGFDWSGTRKVAIHRHDRELVSRIAADIWGAKALLCAITAVFLLILVMSIPRFREVAVLLLTLYAYVLGSMLFPTWLFQGLERMSAIAVTNLCVRTLGAVAIFLFIRRPGDFLIYAIVFAGQGFVAGVIGAATAFKMFRLRLVLPSWEGIRQEMADSTPFFFTTAAISFYTSGNAFILGMLTNSVAVGYYSAAEKIVMAVAGLVSPLSQAVYPRFSRLAQESRTKTISWAGKMLALTGGGSLVLSILLFVSAPLIVNVFLGAKYTPSAAVIAILSPLPVLIAVSNVLGVQLLFPFGHEKRVLVIVLAAGIINVEIAYLLAPHWQASGMAAAVVISEAVVTIGYFGCTWISKLNPIWIR